MERVRDKIICMGIVTTEITLSNARDNLLAPMTVNAVVDTGAMTLCIPEQVAVQLELEEIDRRSVRTADGTLHVCKYVGPIRVSFQNRKCFVGALVIGKEVLLGAVPMEDMDVLVSPASGKLIVNPESPNIASALVL